ncbi:hypothetical protein AX15_004697 [Amanita polypyramis BW_CC]|nr:hypothetical protein AX15_004697 [Amanita polypyramis BW_CC]
MALASTFYNTVFKRNSVFVTTAFIGAFVFGVGYDLGVIAFWDRWNKGVSSRLDLCPKWLNGCLTETMERHPV